MSERPLVVGDKIKDNDPRMSDRLLTVIEIDFGYVRALPKGIVRERETMIREDRIYTDGKPRKSGFSRIEE